MPNVSAALRTRVVTAAALTTMLALAGCSSDSGSSAAPGKPSLLTKAITAMSHAEGTAHGTVVFTNGHSTYDSRWQGTFAAGRGTTSGRLPGPGTPPLEARWAGGNVYVKRTKAAAGYGQSPLGQLTATKPDTPIWTTVPASQIASRVLSPLSPADLVLALGTDGTQAESDGPEVDGVATRKITVTQNVGLVFNWVGPKTAEVLLDGQDRARRITVTYGDQHVRVDVTYTKRTPDVQIPSPEQLAAKTPKAPGPTGPFLAVRSGNDGGVAWTLQKAPGNNGTDCWRWSSTPPLDVVAPNYLTDTRCLAPMTADGPDVDPADQVDFLLWTDGTKSATAAVVARFPADITQATLGFVGGRTETVPVTDGLLTWVGPSAETLGYVGLERAPAPPSPVAWAR